MSNSARNETTLDLMGVTYHVRPVFNAIARIEGATNQSVLTLGQSVLTASIPVSTLAVILHHMAATDENKKAPRVQDIGEYLMDEGIQDFMSPAANFLMRSFAGNRKPRKVGAGGEGRGEEEARPE
jgi:hypothetical protein